MRANGPQYLYGEDDGLWQIDLYPTPVELIGGAVDDDVVAPGFSLNIQQPRGLLDRIDALAWLSLVLPSGDGPRVSIERVYQGQEVFHPVLVYASEDDEPGMPQQPA